MEREIGSRIVVPLAGVIKDSLGASTSPVMRGKRM
jgi:hypothetical protein